MTSKQPNLADYAAAGFLSIKKEEQPKAAVFFFSDSLWAGKVTGYGEKLYRL
jgi:hypothetical protein